MNSWRECAALGFWDRVETNEIEDEEELSRLRWALETVLPRTTSRIGFKDRELMATDLPALLKHLEPGGYDRSMQEVKRELASDAALDEPKKKLKHLQAERCLERYRSEGVLPSAAPAEIAWQLEQLRHAALLWQNLDALGEYPSRPSDAWLHKSLAIAHAVLERKEVLLPESNNSQTPLLERLAEIYVRPYQERSTSNTSEAALGWEVKHVPMPERNLAEPHVETEEPTFGSGVDRVSTKQHAKVVRDLGLGGWSPLSDLADPDHVHFEAELGHAVSIIHLADEADGKIALVNRPGEYHPAKDSVIELMHDIASVGFEIGRHVQSLESDLLP